jgi:uncharacterized protein YcnI
MRAFRAPIVITMLLVATSTVATAHVRVFSDPNNTITRACGYAKFVVRVPVERTVPTTRIELAIPHGVTVYAVQPKVGWEITLHRTRGVVTSVTWFGGRLMPDEFDEFAFLAAAPKRPGPIAWNAWQFYENGEIVRWTGPPKSETPHSITEILPAKCG